MLKIKSKYKIGKRLGASVFEQCQTQKFALSDARAKKASKRRGTLSDYGKQFLEKQKVRIMYGLSEQQFGRYVFLAMEDAQPTLALYRLLEQRLDNVIYRLGFAGTRRAARQMASHGHFTVNGKRMNVPSHQLRQKDTIAVREGSKSSSLFASFSEKEHQATPAWLSLDAAALTGVVTGVPAYTGGETLDLASVLEFYSR